MAHAKSLVLAAILAASTITPVGADEMISTTSPSSLTLKEVFNRSHERCERTKTLHCFMIPELETRDFTLGEKMSGKGVDFERARDLNGWPPMVTPDMAMPKGYWVAFGGETQED